MPQLCEKKTHISYVIIENLSKTKKIEEGTLLNPTEGGVDSFEFHESKSGEDPYTETKLEGFNCFYRNVDEDFWRSQRVDKKYLLKTEM